GRPTGCGAHRVEVAAGGAGTERDGCRAAHLALARSHVDRGVALERLDAIEALRHGLVDVLDLDIFAQANEALAELGIRARIGMATNRLQGSTSCLHDIGGRAKRGEFWYLITQLGRRFPATQPTVAYLTCQIQYPRGAAGRQQAWHAPGWLPAALLIVIAHPALQQ